MDSPMETDYKCGEPDLQLDVDILMLDYLLHAALVAILQDRQNQQSGTLAATEWTDKTERAIDAVDSSLEIFRSRYSSEDFSELIHFRLLLLKFTTTFCRRLIPVSTTPSLSDLQSLRSIHRARSSRWQKLRGTATNSFEDIATDNGLPLSPSHQDQCRQHFLNKFSLAPSQPPFYGTESSVSLLDLLPSFMQLTAARAQLDADFGIPRRFQDLAGEFMLQSSLETCLCFGGSSAEVAEAFSWGFIGGKAGNDGTGGSSVDDGAVDGTESVWEGESLVNAMLKDDMSDKEEMVDVGQNPADTADEIEIDGWKETRDEYLNMLTPPIKASSLGPNHLLQVAAEYPIVDFEAKIISYLTALSQSIDAPVLVQLEQGQLKGLSIEDTDEFKRKVGLNAWIVGEAS